MTYLLLLFLALPFARHTAPEVFRVNFETAAGNFVIEAHRDWAPHGADRFYELVRSRYYDNSRFFRVVAGRWAQFGINGDPKIAQRYAIKPSLTTLSSSTTPMALLPSPTLDPTLGRLRSLSISATTLPATTPKRASLPLARSSKAWTSSRSFTADTEKAQAAECGPDIRTRCSKGATITWIVNFLSSTN